MSVPLSEPSLRGREQEYLRHCLETGWVSSAGPFVERFEQTFASGVGSPHAVACASGTAALHLAMRAAGVERGDEVWVSTLTFVASVNPVVYAGGTPVLVDSDPATWNLDVELVLEQLECRRRAGLKLPKAIEVVHIVGIPAAVDRLERYCQEHDVLLIEDAAEALGAAFTTGRLAGRQVGTVGRLGCFSFNGNKVVTCGGGGMVVSSDAALAGRVRHLSRQAKLPGLEYRHDEIGYNYRLTNLAAALGTAQLEQLEGFLACKRALAMRYREGLSDLDGITMPPSPPGTSPSYWLFSILVDRAVCGCSSRELVAALATAGIEARPLWTPLHQLPPYAACGRVGSGAHADRLFRDGVSLPSSTGLTLQQQERVISAIRAAVSA